MNLFFLFLAFILSAATVSATLADLSFEAKREGLKKYLAASRNNDDLHSFKTGVSHRSSKVGASQINLNVTVFQPLALTLTPTKQYNLDQLAKVAMFAAGNQSQLLLLPELYLSGYNENLFNIAAFAEVQFGPSYTVAANIAKQYKISILYTYPEVDSSSGTTVYYDSAALIYKDGSTLTNYRKINIVPGVEDTYFGFTRGTVVSEVVELDGVQVALAICFDSFFPEISRSVAINSAQLILIPTANGYPPTVPNDIAQLIIPARALENSATVIYINWIQQLPDPYGVLTFYGDSVVYGNSGNLYTGGSNASQAPGTIATLGLWFSVPYEGNTANYNAGSGRPEGNYMNNNLCQDINTVIQPIPGYIGPIAVPSAPTIAPSASSDTSAPTIAPSASSDDGSRPCLRVQAMRPRSLYFR